MKNPLAIILIVLGVGLGIYGVTQLGDSGASLEVAGIELSAEDSGKKTSAYVMIGLGVLCLIGGIGMSKKS